MDERRYWLALSVCNGIGPVRFQKLLHYFGSAKNAWDASCNELRASGIGEKIANDLEAFKKQFSLEAYEERMNRLQVSYLTLQDDAYPKLLKQIKHPPTILYQKGTHLFNENDIIVGVVGTRKITEYGKEVTELLVSELVGDGCVIVSGLAMGVDAVAANATIAAGGKTIAVLGSGVDVCTPAENTLLYDQILESGGAIVSENPLGMMPNKGSFPARNRIIAGLSRGVLVTEGAQDSGSLITANDAFSTNRKVFAVPGPITSSVSKGPLALIGKGALLVTTAKDIIDALGVKDSGAKKGRKKEIPGATAEERKIISILQDQSLQFDEIVKRSGWTSSQVGTTLSLMEMKGIVKGLDAGFFRLD